jgi:hypothetical protein
VDIECRVQPAPVGGLFEQLVNLWFDNGRLPTAKGFHFGGLKVHTDDMMPLLGQTRRGDCSYVTKPKN